MAGFVDAGQVAQAYHTPMDGVIGALQYYDQLNARKQQKREADSYKRAQIVANAFDPLEVGTGSPWDEVGQRLSQTAYQRTQDFIRQNPNASLSDIYGVAHEQTRGIMAGIDNAKKALTQVNAQAQQINKEYPYLDQTAVAKSLQSGVFYGPDGKLLDKPDMLYQAPVSDAAWRAQHLNMQDAQHTVRKEFADMKPVAIPLEDGLFQAKARPYIDWQTNRIFSAPVSWQETSGQPLSAGATTTDGTAAPTTQQLTADAVPVEIAAALKGRPIFSDLLIGEADKVQQKYPSLKKEDAERVALYNIASQYAPTDGTEGKTPTKLYTILERQHNHQDMLQQQRISNSLQQARFAETVRQHGITNARAAEKEQAHVQRQLNSPFGIATMGMIRKKDPVTGYQVPANPDQYAQLQNYNEPVKLPGTKAMYGYNMNAFSGKKDGIIKEPGTGRPILVHLVDVGGGENGLTIQYLTKQTTTGGTGTTKTADVRWVPNGEAKIIKPDKFQATWNSLSAQLGLPPDKYDKQYNDEPTVTEPEDDE